MDNELDVWRLKFWFRWSEGWPDESGKMSRGVMEPLSRVPCVLFVALMLMGMGALFFFGERPFGGLVGIADGANPFVSARPSLVGFSTL
jgi:hypothetical protein